MNARSAQRLACALIALVQSHVVCAQQERRPPPSPMPCVEVRIGQDTAGRLDCLNRTLRAEVADATHSSVGDTVSGASASQLGQPTTAALKEQLGNAYGHSLVPQRPTRTFAPTLLPTH